MSQPDEAVMPTRFANLALGLDAALCNVAGLIFTLTGSFMSGWLGVPGWVATTFGVVLLAWSFVVTLFANRRVSRRREVDLVIRVNAVFVLLAVAVIALPGTMSTSGRVLLGIAALVTAGFAIAQTLAKRDLA